MMDRLANEGGRLSIVAVLRGCAISLRRIPPGTKTANAFARQTTSG